MKINKQGFTLIELLVVVLIIAILAAIAVPQYQKTVERSRAQEAIILLRTVGNAVQAYYLEHGVYPRSFSQMDIEIPWTGKVNWRSNEIRDVRSNKDWSLQISTNGGWYDLHIGRISGPYKGTGFMLMPYNKTLYNQIFCIERTSLGVTYDKKKKAGSYCIDMLGGRKGVIGASSYRDYFLK